MNSYVLCGLLLFSIANALPHEASLERTLEQQLNEELDRYIVTKEVGILMKDLAEEIDFRSVLFDKRESTSWKEPKITLFCTTCATGVNRILKANTTTEIFDLAITLCIDLGIGNDIFCNGVVHNAEPSIIWLATHVEDETGKDVCAQIFPGAGCVSNDPKREWVITLPNVTKPTVVDVPYPQNPASTLKVLHLADTHYDPKYLPGSNTQCPEVYFCCNAESGPVADPADAAGYWGDYRNCDIPMWTLDAMYQSIAATHPDIDLIIWTGDLVPHIVWDTSRESNLEIINAMAALIRTYFPNVPVFPAVGNHEASPLNLFPQPYITEPDLSNAWLYVDLANIWSYWLPSDTIQDILYSAFYATEIRPGLKVVSINTNMCYGQNFWLIYDNFDVAQELEFLASELQKSESSGEFVYIIGHHPPGHETCQLTWSREFNKIVARYEDTVSGMFFGHTHNDEYELFFDPDNATRVYDIGYIAQSQTTYSSLNPGYKVYTVEGDFSGSRYRVLEHDNYIMDLDEANQSNVTNFIKLYTASEEYGLPDLSPQSWLDLVTQMMEPLNPLFDSFFRNYMKAGTPAVEAGCDESCKNNLLCRLLISNNGDHTQCEAAGLD